MLTQPEGPVATIGLHASASTWVFNVVRELLAAALGPSRVESVYAEEMKQLPAQAALQGRTLLIKSHHGGPELDAWLADNRARIFLSLRDPRDCCCSQSARFDAPLSATVRWLANDCNRLVQLAALGHPMLRYEDRFFDRPNTVALLARSLGLDLAPTVLQGIFERYETEAVRSYASKIPTLPDERVITVGKWKMDRLTMYHAPHIGDARVGKWRELPGYAPAELTKFFAPFLRQFGYE